MINPSEEDSQTFIVSAVNGEIYRLRGISLLYNTRLQKLVTFFQQKYWHI